MNQIVIIADDLTGAADSAVQFCPFFEDTTLISYRHLDRILEPNLPSSARATALYTNSRAMGADAAYHRLVAVAQGLAKKQPRWIYKKIDSCMRGNIGSESDALLDELDYEVTFITPAFPEMGRTTEDDIHRVYGFPLDQTEIFRDPITPVKESHLSRIVQSLSKYPVGHVALKYLDGTDAGIQEKINRQIMRGVRHIVFDATSRDHLDRIAQLVYSFPGKVLAVGSAGLAGSMAESLFSKRAIAKSGQKIESAGCHLLVCGTASAVTRQQIDKLLERHSYEFIQLPPGMLADHDRGDDFSKTVSLTRSSLLKKNVILTLASLPNSPSAPRRADLLQSADSIVKGLALFVAEVLAAAQPGLLFLTGGDTADAVLTSIGGKGIRIRGEVVTGVVQGTLIGGPLDGLPVVTKAGAFGGEDTLVVMHETLLKKV
jgi:uncharacterized protein YgbK (DUF1537 family)